MTPRPGEAPTAHADGYLRRCLGVAERVLRGDGNPDQARAVVAAAEAWGLPTSAAPITVARALAAYLQDEGAPLCWACLDRNPERARLLCAGCARLLDEHGEAGAA